MNVVEDLAARLSRNEAVDFDVAERGADTAQERQLVRNLRLVSLVADASRTEWSELEDETVTLSDSDQGAAGSTVMPTFGHLNLLEKLGAGGFGEVYRAWDTRLNRAVALKLLQVERDLGPDGEQALLSEARSLARVEHPHVARVYGVEQHGGRLGIWMELVEGFDLKSLVRENGVLAPREVAIAGAQVARALEAIHAAGLLHRDVKPQNVLIGPEGRAVLVDLGAAQWRRGQEGATDISGTPSYMAPEVLRGEQPASPRSDVYSLGVTLFYALTGDLPVQGTLRELRDADARGQRRRLASLRPDLPAKLRDIVEKACHRDVEARYANVADLARDLEAWSAPPRWTRRRMLAAAAVAVVAAGVAAVALWRSPTSAPPLSAQVELSAFRDGAWRPLPATEAIGPGDRVQITVQLNRDAYVYVFNRDAEGSTVVLFPMAGGGPDNPLAAGRPQSLPGLIEGRRMGWGFTPVEGSEEFLVLASEAPLEAFEREMIRHTAVDVGGGLKVRALDGASMEVAMKNARGVMGLVDVDDAPPPQGDLFSLADEITQQTGPDLWMQRLTLRNRGS
jgi:hypothetical protein